MFTAPKSAIWPKLYLAGTKEGSTSTKKSNAERKNLFCNLKQIYDKCKKIVESGSSIEDKIIQVLKVIGAELISILLNFIGDQNIISNILGTLLNNNG